MLDLINKDELLLKILVNEFKSQWTKMYAAIKILIRLIGIWTLIFSTMKMKASLFQDTVTTSAANSRIKPVKKLVAMVFIRKTMELNTVKYVIALVKVVNRSWATVLLAW